MSHMCREFGISRKTGYKIFERYKEGGPEGLTDRSRRPVRYANQLPAQVEAQILRFKRDKPHWGARKIRELLVRKLAHEVRVPAKSTIHAVLDRHGLVEPMGRPRRRAAGTALSSGRAPNELWCVDYKGEFVLGNRRYCYPLTVTDHASRYLLLCEALESTREDLALTAFARLFEERGLPAAIPALPEIDVALTESDRAMLDGAEGPARQLAMRIVLAMAKLQRAPRLIDLTQCHLDCCIHTGPVSVAIAERMRDLGAQTKVPTTLNAISIDRNQWRALGIPAARAAEVERQTEAYLAMGARPSFTCAPYLLDSAPQRGEHIGWAESNAVAFANSVTGAKTDKYPDYLDLCMALTGRAPYGGCHIEANRKARVRIHVDPPPGADDALYPLLGYLAGELSPHEIPVLTGLEATAPSRDDLKAFAAAFATTSAAPMFHIVAITPEAPDLASALGGEPVAGPFRIGAAELLHAWTKLNGADTAQVACVAIGNPHSSFEELSWIARLGAGRVKSGETQAIITTGRAMLARAREAGIARALERFGFRLVTDTCWCMIEEPVIAPGPGGLLTNSGKYVHYGPGLTGRRVRYAGLAACVEAAATGYFAGAPPAWLARAASG